MSEYRAEPPYARPPRPDPYPVWSPPAYVGRVQYPQPIPPGEEYIVYDAYAIDGLDLIESELAGADEDLAEFEAAMGRTQRRLRVRRHRRRHFPPRPLPPRRRRRGYLNQIDLLDDEDALMGFMGISEDDLDFVESFGGSMMVYGQEGGAPGQRLRTFFSEKVPALVEKFKQKATIARVRAQQLENKAEQAVLRARELQARAAAGQPVSDAIQQTFPPQRSKTLTTPQVVGIAALALAGGYLIAKKL